MSTFKRKTPDEILRMINKLKQGKLKIYIGAVSGSGKTYHMLRDGQLLKQEGIDVAICAVSTLRRPETIEQLGDLERIPSIHWMRQTEAGTYTEQKDLNIEAILKRNPEVLLVDHLAHHNRPEAAHATRWEDIQYLQQQGISVMVTVNVYELKEAAVLVQYYTGRKVEYTVPEDVLAQADEVRLIDVTPEVILQRYAAGHLQNSADRDYFQQGNLAVLRELALRTVAEGVSEMLEKHRAEQGIEEPTGITDRIMVSVQYYWNGSIHIRRGQQIARRLEGDLFVVSFRQQNTRLSNEELTFKDSFTRLTEQIGGQFEEVLIHSKYDLSRKMIAYARQHQVTRIVLGHSKLKRWQEWITPSIVNRLLRRSRNVDIFLVADRAEQDGERIMSIRSYAKKQDNRYKRLPSEELERQMNYIRRGTFKIYIGAAPGVGKTYTMLREGKELMKQGIDVVIGLLETHNRKETADQAQDLPMIPKKAIEYGDRKLEEMDLQSILLRNPEVVLVDELAHTNIPGSPNDKRYEDIKMLLEAGIAVISTVNIQHLESLNDAVEQITGVKVRETVPDSILHLADEVQLIDVTPETLRQRLTEGKIYAAAKIDQSLNNFFKIGNLIALRELALREVADDVDERMEASKRLSNNGLNQSHYRREVVFVAVKLDHQAEKLIRRGFRTAYRLKGKLVVFCIHTGSEYSLKDTEKIQIQKLQKLTHALDGEFQLEYSARCLRKKELAQRIAHTAQQYQTTQMLLGQSGLSGLKRWSGSTVIHKIIHGARSMDVLIVSEKS